MSRFAGKAVLVTGAASGIGAAAARRFALEGASLALCDVDAGALDRLVVELAATARVSARAFDVRADGQLEHFVAEAAGELGTLNVLVNNAGIGSFGHVDEITVPDWQRIMAVNLGSVMIASRAALPHLRRTRGCIVNTASISGLFADAGLAAYNVAKAGVVSLTRSMALDHGPEGVRVNCICPGGVATPMLKAHMRDPEIMEDYARRVPLGRLGTPEEMAGGICFLASDDASYVTGTALVVDGGVTAGTGQPDFDRLYRQRGWDVRIRSRADSAAEAGARTQEQGRATS